MAYGSKESCYPDRHMEGSCGSAKLSLGNSHAGEEEEEIKIRRVRMLV